MKTAILPAAPETDIPEGFRLLAPDERTTLRDQLWDHRAKCWVEMTGSFMGIRASTFTRVIRTTNPRNNQPAF